MSPSFSSSVLGNNMPYDYDDDDDDEYYSDDDDYDSGEESDDEEEEEEDNNDYDSGEDESDDEYDIGEFEDEESEKEPDDHEFLDFMSQHPETEDDEDEDDNIYDVQIFVMQNPNCQHCQQFQQEMNVPDFVRKLFDYPFPPERHLRQPIQTVNVDNGIPEEFASIIPPFETVPHIVLLGNQGREFIDSYQSDNRSPLSLAEFVSTGKHGLNDPSTKHKNKKKKKRRTSTISARKSSSTSKRKKNKKKSVSSAAAKVSAKSRSKTKRKTKTTAAATSRRRKKSRTS